jgi:LemA protein
MKKWGIVIAVVAVIAIWTIASYNRFVSLSGSVDAQWAQVETQYQRRLDLIPNLVASVKGVLKQEQTVFSDIAEARTRYSGATTVDEKVRAAGQVESALGRLLVITENYPQLKSSDVVVSFMSQQEGTENRIAVERGRFNDTVTVYNVAVRKFPAVLFANIFGFEPRPVFDAVTGSEIAPKVELN